MSSPYRRTNEIFLITRQELNTQLVAWFYYRTHEGIDLIVKNSTCSVVYAAGWLLGFDCSSAFPMYNRAGNHGAHVQVKPDKESQVTRAAKQKIFEEWRDEVTGKRTIQVRDKRRRERDRHRFLDSSIHSNRYLRLFILAFYYSSQWTQNK